jgi:hypothetical protein
MRLFIEASHSSLHPQKSNNIMGRCALSIWRCRPQRADGRQNLAQGIWHVPAIGARIFEHALRHLGLLSRTGNPSVPALSLADRLPAPAT